MACTVKQRRKWRHTWSTWVLITYQGTSYQLNERKCTRCGLTQTRSTS